MLSVVGCVLFVGWCVLLVVCCGLLVLFCAVCVDWCLLCLRVSVCLVGCHRLCVACCLLFDV